MEVYDQYEAVIGLEIHLQLSTASKAFCGDDARFGGAPNTQVSPLSLGHPGTLPRLNGRQVAHAVRLGLALGSTIPPVHSFDRKNYFYIDLPKGYQITQDRAPVCVGGLLRLPLREGERLLRIHHIHMEEDAGKSVHDQDPDHTLVDLNRAGVPLLEIVTEPDLRTGEEVDACMTAFRQLARYLDISDGNMQEGSMRCDINVSVRRKGDERLGERCEVKNVNSMKYARQAIEHEFRRQVDIVERGGKIVRETLQFVPSTGRTVPMRDKESANDYRYFPDPDLPPVRLSPAWLAEQAAAMPELPWALRARLQADFRLPPQYIGQLTEEKATAAYFLAVARHTTRYEWVAGMICNRVPAYLSEAGIRMEDFPISAAHLAELAELVHRGDISATMAQQGLWQEMLAQPGRTPREIAEDLQLFRTTDADALAAVVDDIVSANADKVDAYRKGKKGLMGYFMGEVMRATGGKADPPVVTGLLRHRLEEK
jgi:aspartyl-tRNA(Asn)/glutamyl-tRNA(Gln) amidotransferase subunit B